MTARSRGYNQDWDPMREDFDNSSYDPQNAEDSNSGLVNLDHSRLYITNIPNGLNDDGLYTACSKYGHLTEVFVSKNPEKRYALVAFETPGEAKLAMMKLNRTEPLKLNISIAYKSLAKTKRPFDNKDNSGNRDHNNSNGPRNRDDRGFRDDAGSTGSRSNVSMPPLERRIAANVEAPFVIVRKACWGRQESLANGDNMEDVVDNEVQVLSGSMEPDVNLELEKLKLEHLKLQEAQVLCKHRMLLLQQAEKKSSTSRFSQMLPNGRIVVRTIDRGENDADGSVGAGAGDAPNIPALQTAGACVACGARACAFCSGCRVTPYCSPACQRRDWARHKTVCHNLKRQSGGVSSRLEVEPEPEIPAPAPLRRPRSPRSPADAARDSAPDRMPPKKFGPPGSATTPTPVVRANNARNDTDRGRDNRSGNRGRSDDWGQENRGRSDNRGQADHWGENSRGRSVNRGQPDNRGQSDNRGRFNRSNDGEDNRPNARANDKNKDTSYYGRKNAEFSRNPRQQSAGQAGPTDDEDWGPKPDQKPSEPTPSFAFKPKSPSVKSSEPEPEPHAATPGPAPAPAPAAPPAVPAPSTSVPEASTSTPKAAETTETTRPLLPKTCLVDLLPANDSFMLAVDSKEDGAWICTALHGDYSDVYEKLLDPMGAACEASEPVDPQPGHLFAFPEPEGWYRARCLSPSTAALIDAARVVSFTPDVCRKLPADYMDIAEFSCQLESDKVQLKDQVQCTIVSKSGAIANVSLVALETGAGLGSGTVRRWQPRVQYPKQAARPAAQPSAPSEPPQVPRPPVTNNSRVVIVDAATPERVFVRPAGRAQAEFDDVLCEAAMCGADENTPRLTELPTVGQLVIAQFEDGLHYRALVQRVSSKLKRCLLEYVEYGNVAIIDDLSALCPCPERLSLDARPTLTSHVSLQLTQQTLSAEATAYLERLKDDATELTLTIPSGAKSGPSKTPVRLTVCKSNEDVNVKVDSLSTPEWQKLLERGGDVLETETLSFADVQYVDPPAEGGEMVILDYEFLSGAMLMGHQKDAEHAKRAFALAPQLEAYCNSALAKDPYLPKAEELCIAMCPKKKQWLRGTLLEQKGGPGGGYAQVLFYDYGHIDEIPVTDLRKMMPEFARVPAAACTLVIRDFPKHPTDAQLEAAKRHLKLDDKGVGTLTIARAARQDVGEYLVDAPNLILAMQQ